MRLLLMLVTIAWVSPAAIVTPTGVTASSTFSSYNMLNLIDGSGMTGSGAAATAGNVFTQMWLSNSTPTATLTFDLGGTYDLASALVWNYNYPAVNRSVRDMTISTSLNNVLFTTVASYTDLAIGTGVVGLPAINLVLPTGTSGRYVQFGLTKNWGDASFIGLSEVRFEGTESTGVPEPSTFALVLAAGGLLALTGRKRR